MCKMICCYKYVLLYYVDRGVFFTFIYLHLTANTPAEVTMQSTKKHEGLKATNNNIHLFSKSI